MFLHSSDIQGTCATSGDGLYEGLSWLKQELTQKQIKTAVKKPLVETKDSVMKSSFISSWLSSLSSYFMPSATTNVQTWDTTYLHYLFLVFVCCCLLFVLWLVVLFMFMPVTGSCGFAKRMISGFWSHVKPSKTCETSESPCSSAPYEMSSCLAPSSVQTRNDPSATRTCN